MKDNLAYNIFFTLKVSTKALIKNFLDNAEKLLKDYYRDKKFNIRTEESVCQIRHRFSSGGINGGNFVYMPTSYYILKEIMDYLKLNKDDIFVDLGCGKGRAMFVASMQGVKKVIGVEIEEGLVKSANENAGNFRFNKSALFILHKDVIDLDLSEGTVFFMFNPFGEDLFSKVIENIKASLKINPRGIRIVYYVPVYREILNRQDWLVPDGNLLNNRVLVWRNVKN
ncbi:MAG: methyltransferase domain-containing protein [Candidatus Omnitrophica bacterium]|nr:methyltransferase domain-containing protein [Candidatus Omnitrophota bacterium]